MVCGRFEVIQLDSVFFSTPQIRKQHDSDIICMSLGHFGQKGFFVDSDNFAS